jgi:NTE family protein
VTQRFTLVLSGGGLKGLAHIGVLRALAERGLTPSLVVGSSMGAIVAGAWAGGTPLAEMERQALEVKRRDVFRVAHMDMALHRMMAPSLYRREPLDTLITSLIGDRTFRQLEHRLLINTVDLNAGVQVLWGLPGLEDVSVADAVFASCALPGVFPPREIGGRFYVDGAVMDNLPVRLAAAAGDGPVIAVNVAATSVSRTGIEQQGFAATYVRGLEMVMQVQIESYLRNWQGPPLVLVQPNVEDISMFAFDHTRELIDEGYRSMAEVLDALGSDLGALDPGIHPRRRVRLSLDRARCIGCGSCTLWAPTIFKMNGDGKPDVISPLHEWSPVDGGSVLHCPTRAIAVHDVSSEVPAEVPAKASVDDAA